MDRGEHTARWLERLADAHEAASTDETKREHNLFHGGTAILYRARATDIRAGLDLADDAPTL